MAMALTTLKMENTWGKCIYHVFASVHFVAPIKFRHCSFAFSYSNRNFVDGHRSGHGYCITADGTYFEGNFVDNESLSGNSIAYFPNESYYVGELIVRGPNGRGQLYLPSESLHHNLDGMHHHHIDADYNPEAILVCGSILSGSLGGNWENVKINHGNVLMNQTFDKFPNQFGQHQIDCRTKWMTLFSDWEHDVFDGKISEITDTRHLWRKIIKYIDGAKQIELLKSTIATSEMICKSDNNEAAANPNGQHAMSTMTARSKPYLYESLQKNTTTASTSANALVPKSVSLSRITGRNYKNNLLSSAERTKSISNEFLNNAMNFPSSNQLINGGGDDSGCDGADDDDYKNQQNESKPLNRLSTAPFTSVPHFGITKLDAKDLRMLREYLVHAFKNQYHPLGILNSRISYCFYTSYGCWKMKPISILSKHAMQEWESISQRIYDILRRLFPTLPLECGQLDEYVLLSLLSLSIL